MAREWSASFFTLGSCWGSCHIIVIKGDIWISGIFERRRKWRKKNNLAMNTHQEYYANEIHDRYFFSSLSLSLSAYLLLHLASTCMAFVQLTIGHDMKLILQNKNDLFPSFFHPSHLAVWSNQNHKSLLIIEQESFHDARNIWCVGWGMEWNTAVD